MDGLVTSHVLLLLSTLRLCSACYVSVAFLLLCRSQADSRPLRRQRRTRPRPPPHAPPSLHSHYQPDGQNAVTARNRLSATAGLVGCGDGRLRRPCRLGARPAGRVTRRTVVTRLLLDVPADTPVPAAQGAVSAPSRPIRSTTSWYLLSPSIGDPPRCCRCSRSSRPSPPP